MQNQQIAQSKPKVGIAALKDMINNDVVKKQFQDVLKDEAAGFITSVISVCQNNALLSKADAKSVILAAFGGEIDNPKAVYLDSPQNEVGEPVEFEEVDAESGEVAVDSTVTVTESGETPNGFTTSVTTEQEPTNGELFNEPRQHEK